ncbi:MAG: HepT-like ribonuclease domain-containing protein [Solirubrobacteraceae bacterium]
MSPRKDDRRLRDIEAAITAIERHLKRGTIDDELVFDACRARLIEIGEAVKGIDPELLARSPGVPWREIARMRDHLTHRYFDTLHEIVADVIERDLPSLS